MVFLMDRFGYAKTVDVSVYERNKEAADSESRYVVHCMNTGRLCLFTDAGRMHQVRVLDLPYGRFREKGTPIDNVSNYSSSEEQIDRRVRRGADAVREASLRHGPGDDQAGGRNGIPGVQAHHRSDEAAGGRFPDGREGGQ